LSKTTLNKFWEKNSIETIPLKPSDTQSGYENFVAERDALEKANQERTAFAKKAQEKIREK
jgi:hypothetical protein